MKVNHIFKFEFSRYLAPEICNQVISRLSYKDLRRNVLEKLPIESPNEAINRIVSTWREGFFLRDGSSNLLNRILSELYERNGVFQGSDNYPCLSELHEALTKLNHYQCDLVITDIEMPDMSGFELTQLVRNNDKLRDIPVIIVTNKEKEIDRQQSREVGADVYILKSDFDQKNLLTTVTNLLQSKLRSNRMPTDKLPIETS